jgi:hypothetical protein
MMLALVPSGVAETDLTSAADRAATPSPSHPAGQGQDGPAAVAPEQAADCRQAIKGAAQGTPSTVVIELEPSTVWRPRGGEVRFFIRGSGITVQTVQACFAWSQTSGVPQSGYLTSPLVRVIASDGERAEYGAIVPGLAGAHPFWPMRLARQTATQFTGFGIVPVADMQVLATVLTPRGNALVSVAVILPVGVTSVGWSILLVVASVLGTAYVLYRFGEARRVPGRNPILKIIATRDGYASLSQFQIILWTFVVGAGAVYVMALSGNLIAITGGALVLLGIAGGATLLARVPSLSPAPLPAQTLIARSDRVPRWSDLVVVEGNAEEIDVTRLQMLVFTCISAAFVTLKVLNSYEIPEIPDGFLILMGLSNGVYVTGKHLPSLPKEGPLPSVPPPSPLPEPEGSISTAPPAEDAPAEKRSG